MQHINVFDRAIKRVEKKADVEARGDLFEFEPVSLTTFVTDKLYLGLPPLSERQAEAVEYATQIYKEETLHQLHWKVRRVVDEVCLLWGKGCKSFRMKNLDINTGELKTMKEWTEDGRMPWLKSLRSSESHHEKPSIVNMKASTPWRVKRDLVYRIKLKDGSETDVNLSHRFFKHRHSGGWRVKGDWVSLKDLHVGDRIATSVYDYETNKNGNKKLLWILGLLIGDGILSSPDGYSCGIVIDDRKTELIDRLGFAVSELGCMLHKKKKTGWSDNAFVFSIIGKVIGKRYNFILSECQRLGLAGKNAYSKFVPDEIYTYNKASRVEFLRGLLETDGWVSSYNIFKGRVTEIGYSSASKELVFGVKRLLASLGVRCRIREKLVSSKHGIHYTLKVRDKFNGLKLLCYLGWESKAEWSDKGRGSRSTNNEIVFEEITSIEFVDEEDVYDLEVEDTHNYVDADGFLNHNSGKDYVSRIILLRVAYLLLALRNPQAYYYHPDQPCGIERIDMLNTATTKEQAGNVFFAPLRKYVQRSPCFKDKAEVLKSEIKFDKGIYLISGHSEAEAQEGLNLIICILDEIAAFKTDEEVADLKRLRLRKNIPQSAASLYDFAKSTIVTRFAGVGKVVLLSFPRFRGDFIMTKYEEGLKKSNVYVSKGSTYQINPIKKKSDFAGEMKDNLERYKARIECEPGIAEDAFFKNIMAIKRSFKLELPNPVDHLTNRFKPWFVCKDEFTRFGHVDLSKNRDLAAFAFVHSYEVTKREVLTDGKESIIVEAPLMALDCLVYFKARPGGEVDYEQVKGMMLEFIELRGFHVGLITFDGYQSVQMRQNLEDRGIECEELSVDRTRLPYESWQDAMYEGRFISYYIKDLVEEEIPFLIDYKGRKIEHRQGRHKDGSDAVAGAVHNCAISGMWGAPSFWVA
jgi:intein/homing endonuclease